MVIPAKLSRLTTGHVRYAIRRLARHSERAVLSLFARRLALHTITHVDTKEPVVALTFDDGPDATFTPRLLDILARHQARATFFMVGEAAVRHPDVVERVAQEGHAIGNHSWSHSSFRAISRRERRAEIRNCERAIAPYGSPLFRPPFGAQSIASCFDASRLGYQAVTWNVELDDWYACDADQLADRMLSSIRPGSIILLHDALYAFDEDSHMPDREPMLNALDKALTELSGSFRFVTIPDLLRAGRPASEAWIE